MNATTAEPGRTPVELAVLALVAMLNDSDPDVRRAAAVEILTFRRDGVIRGA